MSREQYQALFAQSLMECAGLSWVDAWRVAGIDLDENIRVLQEQEDKRLWEILSKIPDEPACL